MIGLLDRSAGEIVRCYQRQNKRRADGHPTDKAVRRVIQLEPVNRERHKTPAGGDCLLRPGIFIRRAKPVCVGCLNSTMIRAARFGRTIGGICTTFRADCGSTQSPCRSGDPSLSLYGVHNYNTTSHIQLICNKLVTCIAQTYMSIIHNYHTIDLLDHITSEGSRDRSKGITANSLISVERKAGPSVAAPLRVTP